MKGTAAKPDVETLVQGVPRFVNLIVRYHSACPDRGWPFHSPLRAFADRFFSCRMGESAHVLVRTCSTKPSTSKTKSTFFWDFFPWRKKMVMAGRGRGSSCDTHETPIARTRNECTAEARIGGVGSIHRTCQIVMGVAQYIRHPTEPIASIPRILSVPLGRESTEAVASRPQRKETKHEQRQITERYHDRIRKI